MCLGSSHRLAAAPESDLGGSGPGLPPAASLLRASLSDQPRRPANGEGRPPPAMCQSVRPHQPLPGVLLRVAGGRCGMRKPGDGEGHSAAL